jgi:hypothetical protein
MITIKLTGIVMSIIETALNRTAYIQLDGSKAVFPVAVPYGKVKVSDPITAVVTLPNT